jgi:hypothetical protein
MPGFCINCGSPLLGAFCNNCGAKAIPPGANPVAANALQAVPIAPPPQPVYQPVTPASVAPQPVYQPVPGVAPVAPVKSSGMGKVLLWVGAILLVLFVAGAGATMYGVYWVKHKVKSYASAITGGLTEPMKVVEKGDTCRMLSTADLQQLLGVTIEKSAEISQGSDPGCAYYTNDAGLAKLQHLAAEQARKQSQQAAKHPSPAGDNPLALLKDPNQMEGIMKNLTMSESVQQGQIFSFTIQRGFGSDSWSGMRLVDAALPGFEDVTGVGDRAMIASFGHSFYFQKGDTMVHMDTTLVPDVRTRGAQIGKKIAGNL